MFASAHVCLAGLRVLALPRDRAEAVWTCQTEIVPVYWTFAAGRGPLRVESTGVWGCTTATAPPRPHLSCLTDCALICHAKSPKQLLP